MTTDTRSKYCPAIALCTILCLAHTPLHAGKLYKWIDDNGQIRYGDSIPPQYAEKRNETLNTQGIVVETKDAAKTPEQIAEEERLATLQAEEETRRREQAHKDRILLDTFTNEDEMIMTRDGKIESIEAVIRITIGRNEKLKQRLTELTRNAANLERSGKPVPEKLTEQISETRDQIHYNLEYIENRKHEQQLIREKFEIDISRFRELKMARAKKSAKP